jgi:uncharacterized protein (TIGR00106 family)
VIVVMFVRALTGPIGAASTAGLAVVAAAIRPRPELGQVVGHHHPELGGQWGVVLAEVGERDADAWLIHVGQTTRMIAAFSLTPLGIGESVGASVADAVRLVRESGLPNETNAMFTNVEGDWDEVMNLIKACVMKVAETAPRVSVVIKVDHRPGVVGALQGKLASIEEHLRRG